MCFAAGLTNITGTEAEAAAACSEIASQSSRTTEDRNDDYCAVCRNGGDLLCCDRCPRVYHLKCHVPALSSTPDPNVTWLCTLCAGSDDKLRQDVPDARGASTGKRRLNSCGLTDKELQVLKPLLFCKLKFLRNLAISSGC
jgi:PHD-finger